MNNEINEQLENEITNNPSFNLKGIKDITLANGKRIIVMFKNNSMEPTVIEYKNNSNILEDVNERMKDPNNFGLTAEEVLDQIAKEQNSYQSVKAIYGYEPSPMVLQDEKKIKKMRELLKQAKEKNLILPQDEQFAYIDETNDYIMTKTGKILEIKMDNLENTVAQSPESASEYKDEELNEKSITTDAYSMTGPSTTIKESEVSDEEIEKIYEEIFKKGNYVGNKAIVIDRLKQMANDPNVIEKMPKEEQEWYYSAYDLMKTKEKKLIYTPNNKESGMSNYVYIALVVLLIAFAVFMYIVFRR